MQIWKENANYTQTVALAWNLPPSPSTLQQNNIIRGPAISLE